MNNKWIYIGIVAGFLWGCTEQCPDSYESILTETKPSTTVRLVDMAGSGIYNVIGLVKQGNKIVVGTLTDEGFSVDVDMNENTRLKRIPSSKKLMELSSFSSFNGESVTAFDFRNGELVEQPLMATSRTTACERITRLPEERQHLVVAKAEDLIIATGLYEEGRYLMFNPATREEHYYLSYPDHDVYPHLRELTKAKLYASSVIRIRPDKKAFVCADMYSGLLDFCRIEGNRIERVKLERLHYPKVKIVEDMDSQVAYYKSNPFGIVDMAVTEERVYALYSGKSYEEKEMWANLGYLLLTYDWEGNILKTHTLDVPLACITYDREENVLYGVSYQNGAKIVRCLVDM